MTLVLVIHGSKILLGYKKRGFGQGRWNGFGGKIKSDETRLVAAKREVMEEIGVVVDDLVERGQLTFVLDTLNEVLKVTVYVASHFTGQPIETEEMKPKWFDFDQIPYDLMWIDDKFWLPLMLNGKNIRGKFHFKDEQTLLNYKINVV